MAKKVTEDNIIVLKSVFNKTFDQVFKIQPCKDPLTGMYPPCVREVEDERTHKMILSEKDKQFLSSGGTLLPASKEIVVRHNQTFDLNDPRQAAVWEAIKHSRLIAPSINATNEVGESLINGASREVMDSGVVAGGLGAAVLYIERPGLLAKNKNSYRKLINQATNFILNDPQGLSGWITKCKLLEKDMSRANSSDVEDYLLTQAEKYPEKIIQLYTGTNNNILLMLIDAQDKKVVKKSGTFLVYGDNFILGSSIEEAVNTLLKPENAKVKDMIKDETYPDLKEK